MMQKNKYKEFVNGDQELGVEKEKTYVIWVITLIPNYKTPIPTLHLSLQSSKSEV